MSFLFNAAVLLAGGSRKQIRLIEPGESVWSSVGPARVIAVIECSYKKREREICLMENDLVISPWSPILLAGSWTFPANICERQMLEIPTLYQLVLDDGHIIDVNDILCATVGHNFTGPVIGHSYFGSSAILDDLKARPGWAEGRPYYRYHEEQRDSTGKIVRWSEGIEWDF